MCLILLSQLSLLLCLFQGWVDNVSRLFSKIMYSGWITLRLSLLKHFVLRKTLPDADGMLCICSNLIMRLYPQRCSYNHHSFDTSDMGKLKVVDDLLNGAFYLVWVFHMLDYFQVQTGLAVKVRCTLQLVVLRLMSSR